MLIETPDGLDQFVGVGVTFRMRNEPLFAGYGISAESHYVADSQESVVVKIAFQFLSRCPAADYMRNDIDIEFRYDGSADGYFADAVPHQMAGICAVGLFSEGVFVPVAGYVDIFRSEFHETADGSEQFVLAHAVKWRNDFYRREGFLAFVKYLCDFHCIMSLSMN